MKNIQNTKSDFSDIVDDVRSIISRFRAQAAYALNRIIINERWEIGKRIVEEEQDGHLRAKYGSNLLKELSKELSFAFGKGYSPRALAYYRLLYVYFPDWEILHTRVQNLTWSHIKMVLHEDNDKARDWYLREAASQMWSVKTLERNVGSQYYHRLLASGQDEDVVNEMNAKTLSADYKPLCPDQFVKSPVITEFLGIAKDTKYTENDLESSLLDHLQQFPMELGKGYAFVERQQHIVTDAGDYYIDLVFYNYLLKAFVLIDLKTTQITHQDVGQMDMYVRMYDDLKRTEGDNPTIGILLCSETSQDIAKYSILNGSKQLFASKYILYLPSDEELRREIETQKEIYRLQKNEIENG